jgi:hypothetical protein
MERLVAHREHPPPSPRKACPGVPLWLDAVFRKMVAKRPDERYQSATALISDLQRRAAPRTRRWRRLWPAILLAVLAVGALGIWSATHSREPPPQRQGGPADLPLNPGEPSPEQPQRGKPLDLPVKPTWRTTGECPLIAGVWSSVENKGTLVTVIQHGGDFVATASYKSGDEAVSWRAEGKISRSGHLNMSLVHTQPHPPGKWLPQTRTAVLNPNGKVLEGYAVSRDGEYPFTWQLLAPRRPEETEISQ